MPHPTQILTPLAELLPQMIVAAGVHEGWWTLALHVGPNVGAGPDATIAAGVFIHAVGIQMVDTPTEPHPLVMDAAKINPPRSSLTS